ncbi:hypothetical protein [Actinomadura sp. 9N215]|uniref:hypothetical protein n=1 Tax=Actinomadura sp. 9N215 TaxID=3375150 RepID=UPI0037A242F3
MSFVVGVTGISLQKLLVDHSGVSNMLSAAAFIALVVFVAIQLFRSNPNKFKGKKKVDIAWRALLTRADSSVDVFGGDVSWAEGNKESISRRTQFGVVVRVLCRWPRTPAQLEHVRKLTQAGVKVRFYSGDLVRIRGLIVDADIGASAGTALTVVKTPKRSINVTEQDRSMFDYEAQRHLPSRDSNTINMLHQLFESIWENLPEGVILNGASLSRGELRNILVRVPHYRSIKVNDIEVKGVAIHSLYSCCQTVKATKLDRISLLLEAYRRFTLDPFEACKVEEGGKMVTLLPPIIERQPDGRMVVIDGMHRLFQLATRTDLQQSVCLVLSNVGPLPSQPIPFQEVRVSSIKIARSENFINYNHDLFRDVKIIDRNLRTSIAS